MLMQKIKIFICFETLEEGWKFKRFFNLGQKWQRTQVVKKGNSYSQWGEQHTSRGPGSFLFGEGEDVGFLVVPSVFSLCSNQDLNEFPTCSSSSL